MARVASSCPNCGGSMPHDVNLCPECGTHLIPVAASVVSVAPAPPPGASLNLQEARLPVPRVVVAAYVANVPFENWNSLREWRRRWDDVSGILQRIEQRSRNIGLYKDRFAALAGAPPPLYMLNDYNDNIQQISGMVDKLVVIVGVEADVLSDEDAYQQFVRQARAEVQRARARLAWLDSARDRLYDADRGRTVSLNDSQIDKLWDETHSLADPLEEILKYLGEDW